MSREIETLKSLATFASEKDEVRLRISIEGIAPGVLLKPETVASLLQVPIDTLRVWRTNGRGPAFVKLRDRWSVAYRPEAIIEHLSGCPWQRNRTA